MTILLYLFAGFLVVASLNILYRMPKAFYNHPIEDYLVWTTFLFGACAAIYKAWWLPLGIAFLVAFVFTILKILRHGPSPKPTLERGPPSERQDGPV